MYIKQLTLKDFRNYESAAVSFLNGTNLIYGNNAQGKTNLLEAVFLFCTGRSHRRATDREMIREGADWCEIDVEFCDEVRDYTGQMKILDGKKKFVAINKVPVKKISQIADYINVVMFSPEGTFDHQGFAVRAAAVCRYGAEPALARICVGAQ